MTKDRKHDRTDKPRTKKPYPYNLTRNKELLEKLLDGWKWEKTSLTSVTNKATGAGILAAEVVLSKKGEVKKLFVPAADTPLGRAALKDADAETERNEKVLTAEEKKAADLKRRKSEAHKKEIAAKNRAVAKNKGSGNGKTTADTAKLGLGKKVK